MKSIAIWYKPKDRHKESAAIDIHINYWKIPHKKPLEKVRDFIKSCLPWNDCYRIKGKNKKNGNIKYPKNKREIVKNFYRFLDIGLRIDDYRLIEEVYIYFPFEFSMSDFLDKWEFGKNTRLLNAIFNEDFQNTTYADRNYSQVCDSNNAFEFYISKIPQEENKSFLEYNYHNGTLLKINTSRLDFSHNENNKKKRKDRKDKNIVYFRFRITSPNLIDFSTQDKPPHTGLQGAFALNEILDFRINEKRVLDNDLLSNIAKEKSFNIQKIHFLLMCCSREDFIFSNVTHAGCRRLENDIWKYYVEMDNFSQRDTILSYHWKEVKKHKNNEDKTSQKKFDDDIINDFKVLVKTKFEHNNWVTIVWYGIWFGFLTILWTLIYDNFFKITDYVCNLVKFLIYISKEFINLFT